MGMGTRLAKEIGGEAAQAIDDMKDQLLIALLKRIARIEKTGNQVVVPVFDVDDTGQDIVTMKVEGREFVFGLEKKS